MNNPLTVPKMVRQRSGKHPYGPNNIFPADPICVEIGYAMLAAPVASGRVLSRLLVSLMLSPCRSALSGILLRPMC